MSDSFSEFDFEEREKQKKRGHDWVKEGSYSFCAVCGEPRNDTTEKQECSERREFTFDHVKEVSNRMAEMRRHEERKAYAAMAMQGILSRPMQPGFPEQVAVLAVKCADALLSELDKS